MARDASYTSSMKTAVGPGLVDGFEGHP
jgi:hypothetical protein